MGSLGAQNCSGPLRATEEQRVRGQTVKCPGGDNQDGQGIVTEHARMRRAKIKIAEPAAGRDLQAYVGLELDPGAVAVLRSTQGRIS